MKRILSAFLVLFSFFIISCSYEDTATVTIDTGIRQQAQLNWFDRVLAFLSMAQPLQADAPPAYLYVGTITLTITASDMQPIIKPIPLETGKITIEVPAGAQRTFEIVASYDDGEDIFDRYYGGITTIDLSPGENVNLNIQMGELNNKFYYYYYYTDYMTTDYFSIENPTTGVVAFKIYESDDYMYTNEKLKFIITQWTSYFDDGDWIITIPVQLNDIGVKYYRCSVVNQYGEGRKVEITEY